MLTKKKYMDTYWKCIRNSYVFRCEESKSVRQFMEIYG